jgi:manganese oxidase
MMAMPKNTISMKGMTGPFGEISMGGLVTMLKVRNQLESYDKDPGWYKHPSGTVALRATDDELRRDGISVGDSSTRESQRSNEAIKPNGHAGH